MEVEEDTNPNIRVSQYRRGITKDPNAREEDALDCSYISIDSDHRVTCFPLQSTPPGSAELEMPSFPKFVQTAAIWSDNCPDGKNEKARTAKFMIGH
jgi:hypothetical protein